MKQMFKFFMIILQARDVLKLHVDGEYALLVGGVNVSIYCLGMNISEPREYLTLPAGEEGNYAEIYSKRLLRVYHKIIS